MGELLLLRSNGEKLDGYTEDGRFEAWLTRIAINRLRDEIAKLSFRPTGSDVDLHVSTSIGFETFDGKDIDSLETLRRHAEKALRAAKVQGGDRGIYYRHLSETEDAKADDSGSDSDGLVDALYLLLRAAASQGFFPSSCPK